MTEAIQLRRAETYRRRTLRGQIFGVLRAEVLGTSESTIKRDWQMAKAWLRREKSTWRRNTGRNELVAEIPFEFNVGNKTLPAGEYLVRSVSDDSSIVVLSIQSRDGKAGAMLMMRSVQGKTPDRAKLMFNRYGNQYFFAQSWVDADNTGFEAPRSRAERGAQRELAEMKLVTTTVALKSR